MTRGRTGLFVAEGSSDMPLADLVEELFADHGVDLALSRPDLGLLNHRVGKDVGSRISAGLQLIGGPVDVVVVHRDADTAGLPARRREIADAADAVGTNVPVVPVVPVRMTEAWLLLDEQAIRRVAGNPNGRMGLALPQRHHVETIADPKARLREALLAAAAVTGRRRERLNRRFDENRRQLLAGLDLQGPVSHLGSWRALAEKIADIAASWC